MCVAANAAYLRFVGYDAQELIGKIRFGELTAPDDIEGRELNRRLLAGELDRVERERAYVAKAGNRVWGRTSATAIRDAGGELQYVVSIVADISEVRAASARIAQMNAELEERVTQRTAELKTAYQELESFSYSVSHDLRAPLRAISGFASILKLEEGERLSEEGRRYVATIDQNARRMGRLIDALLALVRTSRQPLAPASIDVASLARTVCDELSGEYPATRVTFGALPAAHGDEALVRQVFANLVGNALKYSSRNARPAMEIGSEGDPRSPIYFVRDNGVGFDMTYANKLFRPFERLHSEIEFQGTGIGLALTHLIVQRHGGRIWAESAPGKGAIFRFSLAPHPSAG
jgi:hypothetical protein